MHVDSDKQKPVLRKIPSLIRSRVLGLRNEATLARWPQRLQKKT